MENQTAFPPSKKAAGAWWHAFDLVAAPEPAGAATHVPESRSPKTGWNIKSVVSGGPGLPDFITVRCVLTMFLGRGLPSAAATKPPKADRLACGMANG
ncbi:MAG: hypothetical protein WCS94_21835, partial [Verrucomicrobiota bacterium]